MRPVFCCPYAFGRPPQTGIGRRQGSGNRIDDASGDRAVAYG